MDVCQQRTSRRDETKHLWDTACVLGFVLRVHSLPGLTTEAYRTAGETEDSGVRAGCPRISISERLTSRLRRLSRDIMRKFLGPPSHPSWLWGWGVGQVFLCPPAGAEVA